MTPLLFGWGKRKGIIDTMIFDLSGNRRLFRETAYCFVAKEG